MKTFILLLGLFLSFTAFAQWRHDNYFSYPTATDNGHVRISSVSRLSPGVKWVWIHTVGNGHTDDNYFPVHEGDTFDKTISLRYGPGSYQFQILTSTNANKISQYAVEHAGSFLNTNGEELDAIDPTCDIQSDAREIIELAEQITANLQTDLEKTTAIHDWVASNIAYDTDSYFAGTYTQKDWDALTVLHNRKAICQGYSNLTAALNRAVGIRAKVVIGQADVFRVGWSDHAWNKVLVDGRWISMDTTWDAGNVNFSTRQFQFNPQRKYFDAAPEVFARDHRER